MSATTPPTPTIFHSLGPAVASAAALCCLCLHYHLVFGCPRKLSHSLATTDTLHLQLCTLFLTASSPLSFSFALPLARSCAVCACTASVVKAFNIVCHFCQATPSIICLFSTHTHTQKQKHTHTQKYTLTHTRTHTHSHFALTNFPFFSCAWPGMPTGRLWPARSLSHSLAALSLSSSLSLFLSRSLAVRSLLCA